MTKGKIVFAGLSLFLSFFVASPDIPYLESSCATAQAETVSAVETDLGTPLPLRINMFFTDEKGVSRFHHTSISYDGDRAEEYVPLLTALEQYGNSQAEAADQEPRRIIRSLYVHRADNLVTSFAESCAMYGGGMRGRYAVHGRNYDTATGERLTFEDVFTNKDIVANEVAILLSRNYASETFAQQGMPDLAGKVRKLMDRENFSWTLDPCGATFYFNVRSLSRDPYAPIYTATILFDMNGHCFREKYRKAPVEWCMELEPLIPIRVSLGDTVLNTLEVCGSSDGLQIIQGRPSSTAKDGIIDKTKEIFTDPVRLNEIRPVFVKLKDGSKYLYVDCKLAPSPEDYKKGYDSHTMIELENRHELRVYDMNGDKPRRIKFDGSFTMKNEMIHEIETPKEWLVMTSPRNFKLNKTNVPLSEAHRICYVGEDGAPKIR